MSSIVLFLQLFIFNDLKNVFIIFLFVIVEENVLLILYGIV